MSITLTRAVPDRMLRKKSFFNASFRDVCLDCWEYYSVVEDHRVVEQWHMLLDWRSHLQQRHLDEVLRTDGIEIIAPRKRNRIRPKTQDSRRLRHYKRRLLVERFFALIQ